MIPRRVRFAILLAFICHGLFILSARYRLSYDAYTHMLFADHYANDWFSLWSTRWYTGFEVVSYPPLIHQLIAIFIPVLGFDAAFALISWLVTTLYPLSIYAFSRIFAGKTASSYAALASAVMLPIYVTAHIFGQLPFLAATLFALFGAAALAKFLREGELHNFILAISITATTMAAHHATLLVQPFLIFALVIYQLNKHNWKTTLSRLGIFLAFAIPAGIIVIWPFWQWGMHQQLQTSIDHLSRHNFLTDPLASAIFFWPFYFPIGAIIPFLFYEWPRKYFGLQFSFIILFILGLGGTTPLPSLLFGKSWEWLTYDRFAFWASLILTPFFGILFIRFRRSKWMKNRFTLKPLPASLRGTLISALTFFVFTCAAMGSWFTPILFPIQPEPIDMGPIVDFLNEADHDNWRYLTFGFGDQFAYLNLLTQATTLDGSYHTARTLPELRESGIGQIDTVYWAEKGISSIGPILQASGKYGVRWGFVNLKKFVPELKKNGWVFVKYLKNGIQVWENPNFTFQPSTPPPVDPFKSFSWGFFPMLSLITTLALGTVNAWKDRGEKVIRRAHAFIVGLIPLALGFWYYKTVFEFKHEQVYFTYDYALFFLSDGLAVIAVILWLAVQVSNNKFFQQKFSPTIKFLIALCSLITLSTLWSTDWRTSAYIALHFWLIFGLILSMRDSYKSWNTAMLGLCAALSIQVLTGIVGFVSQSTSFLGPLNLPWPGLLEPITHAASIVKLPDGQSFLRAYGTLPHPNILGGFTLICLAGPITLFLSKEKPNLFALLLLALGSSLLAVTFSRSAWIATAIFLLILIYKSKIFSQKKAAIVFFTAIAAFGLTLIPLRELFTNRTTAPTTTTEEFSLTGRLWLTEQATTLIKERPFLGVGAGSFIIQLAERAGERNFVEPVHNVPLLVTSELGILGFVLLLAMVVSIAKSFLQNKNSKAIIIGALLSGLAVISLFDHYLWTLAPGRLMLGFTLGLWEGQIARDE
jgi:O-antigen ligase